MHYIFVKNTQFWRRFFFLQTYQIDVKLILAQKMETLVKYTFMMSLKKV